MASRPKNFRRRVDDDEAGEDTAAVTATKPKPKPSHAAAAAAKPLPPKPKLLSFADEEDGDGDFRASAPSRRSSKSKDSAKTSASAHRLTSSKDRGSSPSTAPPSNVQPLAGEYTAEKLRELQKNTRALASSRPAEPVVVLKGLIKSPPPPPPLFSDERGNAEKRLYDMALEEEEEEKEPSIPDQATIDKIRAKRELLRQVRAAPEYIPLESGGRSVDEDGDFLGRIALVGDKGVEEGKGVFESVEVEVRVEKKLEVVEEDDEDEEEKKWEEEQFRKGLGKRVDDGANVSNGGVMAAGKSFIGPLAPPVQSLQTPLNFDHSNSISRTLTIAEQAEIAVRTLNENRERLRDSYSRAKSSVTAVEERLKELCSNVTDLEKAKSEADEKFIYMQEMKDFVDAVCQVLEEKAPYIEELEEQKQKILKERVLATMERRATDEEDEMPEIEQAIRAAKSALSRGVTDASLAAKAAIAASREHSDAPIEYDEYGRDKSGEKQSRARSRQRRRARADLKRKEACGRPMEGELSTDESDSESYVSSKKEVLETAKEVFKNVDEEYSLLSSIKDRFEEFKKLYSTSYRDAYTSMSIPMIFSYYVRLELLKWDPLHDDKDFKDKNVIDKDFNDMDWHSLLFNYGVADDGNCRTDDPDENLIPQLVEKVAIPILQHDIINCWDYLSTRATKNAVSAVNMIINYFPHTSFSSALQNLIRAICSRLSDAVEKITVPTWDTKLMQAVPNAAQTAAYKFGISVRLLKNICLWKDILSQQILEDLAFDKLLMGKVLPHLQNLEPYIHDAVSRSERVTATLSNLMSGSANNYSSQKLQPFVNYLMRLTKAVDAKRQIGVIDEDEVRSLGRRLKTMLVQINEYDKAKLVLKTLQLKEAI